MDELKPCPTPWCDTVEKPYAWQGPDDKYCVICPCCQVQGPEALTEAIAFDKWNARPTPDAAGIVEMRPMETAPRNRTHILAKTLPRSDHDRFAQYGGRWFVVWHIGTFDGAEDWSLFPGFSVDPEWFEGWAHLPLSAAATIAAQAAEIERLREALQSANKPEWFYHPDYLECALFSPDEVIDESYDLGPGRHVVEIECAKSLPSIWCAVHVRTRDEMDALDTDDRIVFTEHASKEEAARALTGSQSHD